MRKCNTWRNSRYRPQDFLSDGGKLWPLVEGVAKEVGLLDNLRTITTAIRKAGIRIFYEG